MSLVNVDTAGDIIKSFNEHGEDAVCEEIRHLILQKLLELTEVIQMEDDDPKQFIPNMLVFSVTLTNALIEYIKAIEEAKAIPKN